MGFPTRDLLTETDISDSAADALPFSTLCIVGLPVDVQVKDGSVYSGILHTACFDDDHGIVLKKAKMTKKGKRAANLANGALVDTLVILSSDLVQVVTKGLLLPADGIDGKVSGEDVGEAINGSFKTLDCSVESEAKIVKSHEVAQPSFESKTGQVAEPRSGLIKKYVGNGFPTNAENGSSTEAVASKLNGLEPKVLNGEANNFHSAKVKIDEASTTIADERRVGEDTSKVLKKGTEAIKNDSINEDHRFTADSIPPQLNIDNGQHVDISSKTSLNDSHVPSFHKSGEEQSTSKDVSHIEVCSSEISIASPAVVNVSSQFCTSQSMSPTASLPSKGSVSNTGAKEFKLNPGAKTFFPVLSVPRSPTPPAVTTVASIPHIQNNPPLVPVAVAQPEIGISPLAPRPSMPIKYVPYNTLVALNGDNFSQYSQPIVGRGGAFAQPVRYAGQYNPVQAGPPLALPTSPPVMVGRLGQIVYMHPASHDLVQGSVLPSQVSARPLLTSQVPLIKQQGATNHPVPVCVTQPHFVAGVQQPPPFAVASPVPFSQPPFPAARPIAVPGANGPFGSKFI